jgi:hypothetical protein
MSEWKRLLLGRFSVLFALLCFNILVLPLINDGMSGDYIGRVFFSLLFIECGDISRRTSRHYIPGLILAGLALGFGWMVPFWPGPWTYLLQYVFAGILMAFQAVRLMEAVRKEHLGNEQSIVGALCVYLLLGLAWTMAYAGVCCFEPGAFSVRIFADADVGADNGVRHANFSELVYFSFTTLTTLGYGDIVPRTPMARSLAISEVLAGVTYLAVVLSVLVGMLGKKDPNPRLEHAHHPHPHLHPPPHPPGQGRESHSSASQV